MKHEFKIIRDALKRDLEAIEKDSEWLESVIKHFDNHFDDESVKMILDIVCAKFSAQAISNRINIQLISDLDKAEEV